LVTVTGGGFGVDDTYVGLLISSTLIDQCEDGTTEILQYGVFTCVTKPGEIVATADTWLGVFTDNNQWGSCENTDSTKCLYVQ
jgi:hypothetical protein